tara:strand:- start:1863 stop:2588 length:726 start_codon:yes stop_codon:yes gene_type:complete
MSNEFEINAEMKTWAKEHFDNMGIGGVWSPDGTGLTYQKVTDDTWKLIRRMNHPTVEENHMRFATIMMSVGINMLEGDSVDYDPPASSEEAYAQESAHRMEIAQSWSCSGCEKKLIDLGLEDAIPSFEGEQEILLEDGNTHKVEVWAYRLTCSCGNLTKIDPDDFHLLAGDYLFMRYVNSKGTLRQCMTRKQMVEMADAETPELGVVLGSKDPETQERVPSWMWGTYCMSVKRWGLQDEEE